jgi:sulfopyruvate decarboxylase TPP-binding subunit
VTQADAGLIISELKKCGTTHLLGLPDNTSAALFSQIADDPDIDLITVTREGEAFAMASGLWLGGKVPVVLIQNTGLFESGDAYRGTALRMRVPLLCLITYRGYARMGDIKAGIPPDPAIDDYSRADIDSAGIITEPTLKAWALPYYFLHAHQDIEEISRAFNQAVNESRPVAVLITEHILP